MKKSYPATLSNLKKIRATIKDFLKIYEVDLKTIKNIQLAVDEAVTNIIKHSYKEEKETNYIEINLNVIENELEISLCDDGYAVDKKKIKPRNINEIKPTIKNEIPPLLGTGFRCELLLLGASNAIFLRIGIIK